MGGRVVTAAAAHAQAFVVLRQDFDGVEAAVHTQVGGLVGERVLAAQFILDFDEGVGHVIQLKRDEGASAGGLGNALQDFVAATTAAG